MDDSYILYGASQHTGAQMGAHDGVDW